MKDIISKELLSLVLGLSDINKVYKYLTDDNEITYTQYANLTRGSRSTDLNLDTLGRLCKEWLLDNGYSMTMQTISNGNMVCELYSQGKLVHFSGEDGDVNNYMVLAEWVAKEKGLL